MNLIIEPGTGDTNVMGLKENTKFYKIRVTFEGVFTNEKISLIQIRKPINQDQTYVSAPYSIITSFFIF